MRGVARYTLGLKPLSPARAKKRVTSILEQARRNPGSSRWDVEALEVVAAWLALDPPVPDPAMRDRIALALSDPMKIFAPDNPVPDLDLLVGSDLLAKAYWRWLLARAEQQDRQGQLDPWAKAARKVTESTRIIGPIDVGPLKHRDAHTQALAWLLRHANARDGFPVGTGCPELGDGFPAAAARELMPLEGVEYASVVIPVGEQGGALLCMMRQSRERYVYGGQWDVDLEESERWEPDGKRVEVVPVPRRSVSVTVQKGVRRWWRKVNGLPERAGRPPGQTLWTAEMIVDAMIEYQAVEGGPPRSRESFVRWAYEHAGMKLTDGSEKVTGDRWSRELQLAFPALVSAISSDSSGLWVVPSEER